MPSHRTRTLAAATLLLLNTAACSAPTPDRQGPTEHAPTQQAEASLVAYWNQHHDIAPAVLDNAVVLLDEQHTGSHVFTLPATAGYSALTEGVSCDDTDKGRRWIVGFGDEHGVWATQTSSDCAGLGGGLGTYQTTQYGAPTRVYVLVDDDTAYSVGVWGESAPATTSASSPAPR
ncbi:MAG: hypothetical protein ACRYF3_12300 [Janthinobacterium lividum]